ncbi:MAG: hypothetical protein HOP30_02270 [Cyclobacteriaceae bacterium]|nr:hypothetical protein [Cyclobacteriaceae bacterium]
MKRFNILSVLLPVLLSINLFAQEADSLSEKKDKPQRAAFQSAWLIDNVTGVLNPTKTLQFDIQHRFGLINSGSNDLAGFWGPSNIRIALAYSISNNITLGFGTTKDYRLQDFNIKVGLIRQTRSGKIPVSLTFYGNTAIDAREASFFPKSSDRFSYFGQLLIMRRFNQSISLQVAPSFSHYNLVDPSQSNNLFAVALGGKVNISDKTAILIDYNQPLGDFSNNPGLALGIEMSTGSHAFQIFIGNYNRILPQTNYFLNENKLADKQFLIGFNINRLWNF